MTIQHHVRKQVLELDIDSEADVFAFRSRLSEINRRRFLPIIERVFDELDVPGRHIHIANLHIDLGTLPINSFEDMAVERLYHELHRAVAEAVRELEVAESSSTSGNRWRSDEERQLELLEYYLLHGTVPFWASGGSPFAFEELFAAIAESHPDRLVRLIQRHGHQKHFIQRLAFQLNEALFHRLIHLLEPEHAALIIAYMVDLQMVHRIEPLLQLSDERFAVHLRVLVLTYLVCERGSQFNRKSFMKSLLEGMSQSEGLDYLKILRTLQLGLEQTERRQHLRSSLPVVLLELVREAAGTGSARQFLSESSTSAATVAGTDAIVDSTQQYIEGGEDRSTSPLLFSESQFLVSLVTSRLEHFLRTGQDVKNEGSDSADPSSPALHDLLSQLAKRDVAKTRQLIRRIARAAGTDRKLIVSRLLQIFPAQELLSVLATTQSATIIEFVKAIIATLHGVGGSPGTARPTSSALPTTVAWEAAVDYLVFAHRSSHAGQLLGLVRHMIAVETGVDHVPFLNAVITAFRGSSANVSPAFADELAVVRHEYRIRSQDDRIVGGRSTFITSGAELTSRSASRDDADRLLWSSLSVFTRYDQAKILRHYLRHGWLPWTALLHDPESALQRAAASMSRLPDALLNAVFLRDNVDGQLRGLLPVLLTLSADELLKLVTRLIPAARSASPFRSSLIEFSARTEDPRAFFSRVISAVIQGHALALEQFAAAGPLSTADPSSAFSANIAAWDAQMIASALMMRLGQGPSATDKQPPVTELLRMLLTSNPPEAKLLLAALRNIPEQRRTLVERCSPDLVDRSIELVRTTESSTVQRLIHTFADIPAPYRPGSTENIRHSVLYVLLGLKDNQPLSEDFFVEVVQELYGTTVPSRVRELLLQECAAWEADDKIPRQAVSAFHSAVRSTAGRMLVQSNQDHELKPDQRSTRNPTTSAQDTPGDGTQPLPAVPREMDARELSAALLGVLQSGNEAGLEPYSVADFVEALLSKPRHEFREFFDTVRQKPMLRRTLVQACSPSTLERMLELIRPSDSMAVRELMQILTAIPVSRRPGSAADIRRAVLYELLQQPDNEPLTAEFYVTVLRDLYSAGVSNAVRKMLLTAAIAWVADGDVVSPHATAFLSAVRAVGNAPTESVRSPNRPRVATSVASDERRARRVAVLAFLMDRPATSSTRGNRPATNAASGNRPTYENLSRDVLQHELLIMLDESPRTVLDTISSQLVDPQKREYWATNLSESVLVRFVGLLEPRACRVLLDTAELLASAWLETVDSHVGSMGNRKKFWSFLLGFLSRHREGGRTPEQLVADFTEQMLMDLPAASSAGAGMKFIECATGLARSAGNAGLASILIRDGHRMISGSSPVPSSAPEKTENVPQQAGNPLASTGNALNRNKPSRAVRESDDESTKPLSREKRQPPQSNRARSNQKTAFGLNSDRGPAESGEAIYVSNAGLVLAGAFLPRLFQSLEMLKQDEDGAMRFHDPATASRAIHLLQFLVDGRTNAPEPELVLNKLLCGVPLGVPIDAEITATSREIETCELLLKSMIANWTIIANTSIAGLQETFLQRKGRLNKSTERWDLVVERNTRDVLVDRVTWSIAVVFHRWMSQPIHVSW